MVSKKRKDMTDDNDVHAVTSSAASFYAVSPFLFIATLCHFISIIYPFHSHSIFFLIFLSNLKQSQSLETRPRSIYDVLDHEAANKGPEQHKAQPKKKTPHKEVREILRWFITFYLSKKICCDLSHTYSTDGANNTTPGRRGF